MREKSLTPITGGKNMPTHPIQDFGKQRISTHYKNPKVIEERKIYQEHLSSRRREWRQVVSTRRLRFGGRKQSVSLELSTHWSSRRNKKFSITQIGKVKLCLRITWILRKIYGVISKVSIIVSSRVGLLGVQVSNHRHPSERSERQLMYL